MKQDKRYCQELFYDVVNETCKASRILESKQYIQHGNTSVLEHSISVAYVSYRFALIFRIKINGREMIRGALLHDYFLYDWHEKDSAHRLHGFRHPYFALENANRDFELSDIEKDIIKRHMFPLVPIPPRYLESMIVCFADKLCTVFEVFHVGLSEGNKVYEEHSNGI